MEEHLSSTIANLHPLFTRNPNDVGCIRGQAADLPLDLLRGSVEGTRGDSLDRPLKLALVCRLTASE